MSLVPVSTPPKPSQPEWALRLAEAAFLDDGHTSGCARPVGDAVLDACEYRPPTSDYHAALYELGRPPSEDIDVGLDAPRSAGWIRASRAGTAPVFVAHSLLSAVWLLWKSLGEGALPDDTWERVTAACSKPTEAADDGIFCTPTTPPSAQPQSSPSPPSPPSPVAAHDGHASARLSAPYAVATNEGACTVTNNNRSAERKRKRTALTVARKRYAAMGLAAPASQVPRKEAAAYARVSPDNEAVLAWIFKQPVGESPFANAALPYWRAMRMIDTARCVGDVGCLAAAHAFLKDWREHGSPFAPEAATAVSLVPSASVASRGTFFDQLWKTVDRYEEDFKVVDTLHIRYRWSMAMLSMTYHELVTPRDAHPEDTPSEVDRAAAKESLHASLEAPPSYAAFNVRLKRAQRWHDAVQLVGWGLLLLIPGSVGRSWPEQELRKDMWHLWLTGVIERVNPAALGAARDFDDWLGPIPACGPIEDQGLLRIEALPPCGVSVVEEVADGEAGSGSEDAEGGSESRDAEGGSVGEGDASLANQFDIFKPVYIVAA